MPCSPFLVRCGKTGGPVLRIAKTPPDAEYPYGHGRVESIGAKVLAVMVFMAPSIGGTAVRQLFVGIYTIPGQMAIWAVLLLIVVKEAMYRHPRRWPRITSTALIADALEHRPMPCHLWRPDGAAVPGWIPRMILWRCGLSFIEGWE